MANKQAATLENDYERMVPAFHKDSIIYGEHLVRYLSAQKIVTGKVVLDIASGSGYGTASLATTAQKVFGVDVSEDAIAYAKENYGGKNIEYIKGDGIKIPLADDSVDVVVSFETIEHIENYEVFMQEVKRVLKPEGLFLLSTPNDVEFAEGNHFHIHEFAYDELKTLVARYFSECKDYFQADWVYSGIHSLEEVTEEWNKPIQVMNTMPLPTDKVLYFFMLCANRKITETVDSLGSLSQHWSEREQQTKREMTDQHIQNIKDVADGHLEYVRKLEQDIKILQEQVAAAENRKLSRIISEKLLNKKRQ